MGVANFVTGLLFGDNTASWKMVVATYGFAAPLTQVVVEDGGRAEAEEAVTENLSNVALGFGASRLLSESDDLPGSDQVPQALVLLGVTGTVINAAKAPFSMRTERASIKVSEAIQRARA